MKCLTREELKKIIDEAYAKGFQDGYDKNAIKIYSENKKEYVENILKKIGE